jgi:peptidoglycan/LPS O-acetylase OafA/YrhL
MQELSSIHGRVLSRPSVLSLVQKDAIGRVEVSRNFGLDVVRAVAISGVLVCHFTSAMAFLMQTEPPLLISQLGNGVELFFALSGFLIGGLLMDIEKPSLHAWIRFMVRRWMRTVPLYLAWLAILLVVWPPQQDFVEHAVKYVTFTQNLLWGMSDPFFAVSWSLSIEEWFYLLFSATLIGLSAILGRMAIILAIGAFVFGPMALRAVLVGPDLLADWDKTLREVVIYRLDAIAYGVAVAALVRQWPHVIRQLSLPMLLVGVAVITKFVHGPLYFVTLYPAAFAMCLPAATLLPRPGEIVAAPIRWLSTRSYGIYIVHLSIVEMSMVAVGNGLMHLWWMPVVAAFGTFALSELSFRFLETPILRMRPRQSYNNGGTSHDPTALSDAEALATT